MRSIHRIVALAGVLLLTTPAFPVLAQSAPTKAQQQEAATRFKKGLELFKDGDYQAALIEFRRANELAPNFNVLYNIGQVYFQLQDYPNALTALERYLSEGGSSIPSARHADVQKDIDKLRARVANMEIIVTVPDADVSIDDVVIGKSPLAKPILVSAGRHKVTISKVGFTPTTKLVEIASGDLLKVPIDPIEQKVAPIVVVPDPNKPPEIINVLPAPEPPVAPPPPPRSVPWAGIVVTGGLAIGSVVTGVLALGAKSSLQTEVASPTATRDTLDSAHSKLTGLALATDILAGSAIVAMGVTLYVGLSGPSKKDTPAAPRGPGAAPSPAQPASLPTVRVGFGADGVKLLGTF